MSMDLDSGGSYSKGGELPEHVEKMGGGKLQCMHCGGEVDEEGEAISDDVEEGPQEESLNDQEASALFGRSLKGRK